MELNWDEANRLDALESKYFKPETNIKYRMSFSSARLVKKSVPDFNDKTKQVTKVVLCLTLSSLNGETKKSDGSPLDMSWEILSQKCRSAWEPYCRNGNITKMAFEFIQKGEAKERTYQVVVAGPKEGGVPFA
jgi:hypothetical protein